MKLTIRRYFTYTRDNNHTLGFQLFACSLSLWLYEVDSLVCLECFTFIVLRITREIRVRGIFNKVLIPMYSRPPPLIVDSTDTIPNDALCSNSAIASSGNYSLAALEDIRIDEKLEIFFFYFCFIITERNHCTRW